MSSPVQFSVENKDKNTSARAGVLTTPHGDIQTPAFIVVGTKATVKGLLPQQLIDIGTQAVLANTYHLHLRPREETVKRGGGLGKYMNWSGPTFTDSGGFQVFSLGKAFGTSVTKLATGDDNVGESNVKSQAKAAKIDEDGVTFTSHIDGKKLRMTPESSMQIQHDIGADIMFAFDECTSPHDSIDYQKEALDRTHRWATRCTDFHIETGQDKKQGLFGVVQGGRNRELREKSAKQLAELPFAGFGVGGSFTKQDIGEEIEAANRVLPEDKPRHLLGIGEPQDIVAGVSAGCDTFDCVNPTRIARNGTLYGPGLQKLNLMNAKYKDDFTPVDPGCSCELCTNYTRSYISHLYRSKEMLAGVLGTIHNLRSIIRFTDHVRMLVENGDFKNDYEYVVERMYRN
jgi:queuine tRNA-ribosyltransferase